MDYCTYPKCKCIVQTSTTKPVPDCTLGLEPAPPLTKDEVDTPGSRWRIEGKTDPHGNRYACDRRELAGGHFTDDEVANGVFMHPSINWLTVAKDRIRWLSRRLELSEQALKPFAEFAAPNRAAPPDLCISNGSPMAKRQLTMLDCYNADDALKGIVK